VPSPVVAQVWRGARDARLARVLAGCREVPLDPTMSRRTGELCGRAGTSDVVDAFVILSAADWQDDVRTSEPDDLVRLAGHVRGPGRVRTLDGLATSG
jgi:hypothetical protein